MRVPHVKICCISSLDEARMAVAAGASALGLVSHMPSGTGVIDEQLIAQIAASVPPPVATFLLTCRQDAAAIADQHATCRTSTLQLVDAVAPAELVKLRKLVPGTKLVQVIHIVDEHALEEALLAAPHVDALLLDSGNPHLAVKVLGGTGLTHDWQISRRIRDESGRPVFLAGGLKAENVGAALAAVRPFGLDLCTGVRTDGSLDAAKLSAFMQAVARAGSH